MLERCERCLMSNVTPEFGRVGGGCVFCEEFLEKVANQGTSPTGPFLRGLDAFLAGVKRNGIGKPYDCVVGVSGGVDSSWVLVKAVENGLRPLAVHMDNGWNSDLAVSNIQNLVSALKVDLFTYVIDWREYRALMEAFFSVDVIDVELLYDNAATAVCYLKAREIGITAILSGSNTATEGFRMPATWSWKDKRDGTNIRAIARQAGVALSTFPLYTNKAFLVDTFLRGIRWEPFLDYFSYDRHEVLQRLEQDFGYRPYPYKHYENVFTRFYQGFLLPEKFGVDKRLPHLSALVCTGQLLREEGLRIVDESIPYPSLSELEKDKLYFLKKMQWPIEKLEAYLARPRREHDEFESETKSPFLVALRIVLSAARKVWRLGGGLVSRTIRTS